jgi:hypothetical protein
MNAVGKSTGVEMEFQFQEARGSISNATLYRIVNQYVGYETELTLVLGKMLRLKLLVP